MQKWSRSIKLCRTIVKVQVVCTLRTLMSRDRVQSITLSVQIFVFRRGFLKGIKALQNHSEKVKVNL